MNRIKKSAITAWLLFLHIPKNKDKFLEKNTKTLHGKNHSYVITNYPTVELFSSINALPFVLIINLIPGFFYKDSLYGIISHYATALFKGREYFIGVIVSIASIALFLAVMAVSYLFGCFITLLIFGKISLDIQIDE